MELGTLLIVEQGCAAQEVEDASEL